MIAAVFPKQLDGFRAPKRAFARGTNRRFPDKHIHRIGVELGELAQREPTASFDFDFKRKFMFEAISGIQNRGGV